MKQITLLLVCSLMLINCTTPKENQMRLSGFVKGMKEGTLLLQKSENNTFTTIDSMVVKGDAHFNFTETIETMVIQMVQVVVHLFLKLELPYDNNGEEGKTTANCLKKKISIETAPYHQQHSNKPY